MDQTRDHEYQPDMFERLKQIDLRLVDVPSEMEHDWNPEPLFNFATVNGYFNKPARIAVYPHQDLTLIAVFPDEWLPEHWTVTVYTRIPQSRTRIKQHFSAIHAVEWNLPAYERLSYTIYQSLVRLGRRKTYAAAWCLIQPPDF